MLEFQLQHSEFIACKYTSKMS